MYPEDWITKVISSGVACGPSCSFTMDMFVEEFIDKCYDLQRTIFLKHRPEKSSALKAASIPYIQQQWEFLHIILKYNQIYLSYKEIVGFKCSNLTDSL